MKIQIETIPHQDQRYPTAGDWYTDEQGTLHIKVSALSDWRHQLLVAIHELAEWAACKQDGVSQAAVDAFDIAFERDRADRMMCAKIENRPEDRAFIFIEEPGDAPDAPYRKQHCLATGIERIMAASLNVTWSEYESELESLP